jgi:hypothetical protein
MKMGVVGVGDGLQEDYVRQQLTINRKAKS